MKCTFLWGGIFGLEKQMVLLQFILLSEEEMQQL